MRIRTIVTMVVAVLVLASMASAVQVQLACVANAREGNGWDTNAMYMQGLDYGAMMPFFKFDVSAIPTGAVVTSATVYTYLEWGGNWFDSNWQFAAREVLADWGETNPTYPPIDTVDLGTNASVAGAGLWFVNPITPSLVQDWANGTKPNYGVCVSKATSGGEYVLVSNRTSANAPYLLVDYTPVPEPGSILTLIMGVASLGGMVLRRRA